MDAVHGKLLVSVFGVFGVAGDADRANDFAAGIANEHAATFRKNLLAACGNEVAHEDRPLLGAFANELRTTAERKRGVGFAEGHLEPDHRGAILLLERFHLATRP